MKTAGVRELKAKLSRYLGDVRRGETVLITDRGTVVAELRQPEKAQAFSSPEEQALWPAVERGEVKLGDRERARPEPPGNDVTFSHTRIVGLINDLRSER